MKLVIAEKPSVAHSLAKVMQHHLEDAVIVLKRDKGIVQFFEGLQRV